MTVREAEMQCRHCWVPVKLRRGDGRTWGRGEEEDENRWVHAAALNASGNPVCSRNTLSDDDIEPVSDAE